jgi:CheY-like chemotaxis protein
MSEKNVSVLIVDDEYEMRELIASFLSQKGIFPIKASNGVEALTLLQNNNVDVIILDVHMPVMDGIDFILEAKKRELLAPIISISGGAVKEDRPLHDTFKELRLIEKFMKVKALKKPFEFEQLLEYINETLIEAPSKTAPKC